MGGSYTVLPGESWASIAGKIYGNQRMLGELMRANPNFFYLRPGMQLRLPQAINNPHVSEYELFRAPSPVHPGYNSFNEWRGGRQEWAGGKQADIPGYLSEDMWSDPTFLLSLGLSEEDAAQLSQVSGGDISGEDFVSILQDAGVTPAPLPSGTTSVEEAEAAGHPKALSWQDNIPRRMMRDLYLAVAAHNANLRQYHQALEEHEKFLEQFGGRDYLQAQEDVYLLTQQLAQAQTSNNVSAMKYITDALHRAEQHMIDVSPTVTVERVAYEETAVGTIRTTHPEEVSIHELTESEMRDRQYTVPGLGGRTLEISPGSAGEQALDVINQIFGEYAVGMAGGVMKDYGLQDAANTFGSFFNYVRAGGSLLFWNIIGSGPQVAVYQDLYEQGIIEKIPKSEIQGTPTYPGENEIFLPYPDKAKLWWDARADQLKDAFNGSVEVNDPLPQVGYSTESYYVPGVFFNFTPNWNDVQNRFAAGEELRQEVSQLRSEAYLELEEAAHLQRQSLLSGDPADIEAMYESLANAQQLLTDALGKDWWVRDSVSDPYVAGTWATDSRRTEAFQAALVTAEMQKGSPLTDTEIRRIKERFADPITEVALQIFLDPMNWANINFIKPIWNAGKTGIKTLAQMLGIIVDEIGPPLGRAVVTLAAKEGVAGWIGKQLQKPQFIASWFIDLFRTQAARSAANTMRNQLLDTLNVLSYPLKADNGETLRTTIESLQDILTTLARADEMTPELMEEAAQRFATLNLPFTLKGPAVGRYIKFLINAAKVGDPESLIPAVKNAIPERWGLMLEDITQRLMSENANKWVSKYMRYSLEQWNNLSMRYLGEVVEQTTANAVRIVEIAGKSVVSNREITIQFANAIHHAFMATQTHARTGLLYDTFLFQVLDNISYKGTSLLDHKIVQDATRTYLYGLNHIWDFWVQSVLTVYPRWAFRNLIDSTFRVVVDGGGLLDSIRNLTWIDAGIDPALRQAELQETFVRSALRAHGDTVAERILRGEVKTLVPFVGNFILMKQEINRLMPEGASWLGRIYHTISTSLPIIGKAFRQGFVSDYSSAIEYVLRRRLFYVKFLDVYPKISGSALEASLRIFTEAGGSENGLLLARTIAERCRYNPEAASVILRRLSGELVADRKIYSLLTPPDIFQRMDRLGLTSTEQYGLLEPVLARLESIVERSAAEGKVTVPFEYIDDLFKSINERLDDTAQWAAEAREIVRTARIQPETGIPLRADEELPTIEETAEAIVEEIAEREPPIVEQPAIDVAESATQDAIALGDDYVPIHPDWLDQPIPRTRSSPAYLAAGEAKKTTFAQIHDEVSKVIATAAEMPDVVDPTTLQRATQTLQFLNMASELDARLHRFLIEWWPGPVRIDPTHPLGSLTRADAWNIMQAMGEMMYNRTRTLGDEILTAFRAGDELPEIVTRGGITADEMLEMAGIQVVRGPDGNIVRIKQVVRPNEELPRLYATNAQARISQFVYEVFGPGTRYADLDELMSTPFTGRNFIAEVVEEVAPVAEEAGPRVVEHLAPEPYQMTSEEFHRFLETTRIEEANLERSILGDDYDAWIKAQRQQGSRTQSVADHASDEIERIEAKLSQTDRDRLYGIGEAGRGYETLKFFQSAFEPIEDFDDEWLISEIRRNLPELDPTKLQSFLEGTGQLSDLEQLAYMKVRNASKVLADRGYSSEDITKAVGEELSRLVGTSDAQVLLQRWMAGPVERPVAMLEDLTDAEVVQAGLRQEFWDTVRESYNWNRYGDVANTPSDLAEYFRGRISNLDPEAQPELFDFYQQELDEIEYLMRIFDNYSDSMGSVVQLPMPLRNPFRPSRFDMPEYWQRTIFQMEWRDQQLKATRELVNHWYEYLRAGADDGSIYLNILPRNEIDLLKNNWLPEFVAGRQRALDVAIYGSDDMVPEVGSRVEGALHATQETMLDYQTYLGVDQFIKDNIFPFWLFTSGSIPMWVNMIAEKPQLLGWWAKYLRFTDMIAYQEGAVTSKGEVLPSLRGCIPIPGTNFWVDPTSVLSLGYVLPWGKYKAYDERSDLNVVQQISQWVIETARYFGASESPWLHYGQVAIGALDPNYAPTYSLISPMDLIPRWMQRWIQQRLAQHHLPDLANWAWSSEWPHMDFLVERRMLSWLLEEIRANPDQATTLINQVKQSLGYELTDAGRNLMRELGPNALDQPVAHNESFYTLQPREDNTLWMRIKQEVEQDQWTGSIVGYFTGFYPKPYTDAELAVIGARQDINLLRDMINNEIGAYIFHLDPNTELRYERYLQERYETPEGWVQQLYNAGAWLQTPAGEQAFGDERRELMAQNVHEDTVTQSYWAALQAASNWLQGQLNQLPIGAPSEDRARIWEQYWNWRELIQTHPFYNDARRQSFVGLKPTSLIVEHLKDEWYYRLRETRPSYDPSVEYAEYQSRIAEWEEDIPDIARTLEWAFYMEAWDYVTGGNGLTTETFKAFLTGAYPIDDERWMDVQKVVKDLVSETDVDTFMEWMKGKDTPMDALNEAWRTLYWDPYWKSVEGLTGAVRDEAEMNFLQKHPKPNGGQLADWVMEYYPDRWTRDELIAMTDSGIKSVEERLEADTETGRLEDQVWEVLGMCGRDTEWLRRAVIAMGGDADDFTRFYSNGANAWRDSDEFNQFVERVVKAAEIKNLQPLTRAQIQELANAQRLNDIFRRIVEKHLGDDFYNNLGLYYELDTTQEKKAFRDVYSKIDEYWDMQENFAGAYQLWAKYYNSRNYNPDTALQNVPKIVPGVPTPQGFTDAVQQGLLNELTTLTTGKGKLTQAAVNYLKQLAQRHPEWSVFIELVLQLNVTMNRQY